jgi:cell division protein FtsL
MIRAHASRNATPKHHRTLEMACLSPHKGLAHDSESSNRISSVINFSLAAAWLLTWQAIVPEKNEQLNTKQGIIESKQDQIDRLTKERDHAENEIEGLAKRVEDLRIYRAQDAMPLKKKALLLARQIMCINICNDLGLGLQ